METKPGKDKAMKAREEDTVEQPYFYPGSGEYEPVEVRAKDQAAADREWEKVRVKVAPAE